MRRARRPVKRARRRPAAVSALTVLALTASAGAAIALAAAAPAPGPVPPLAEAGPVRSIEPALSSSFALLRRSQAAADVVPGAVAVALSQASGANISLARRVQGAGDAEAWLIPGRGNACILAREPERNLGGAVCTSAEAARAVELNVQSANASSPDWELVAGVVPDGTAQVTLQLSGGATTAVPVHENVYLALVQGAVVSIAASGASGPLQIPAMSASEAGG